MGRYLWHYRREREGHGEDREPFDAADRIGRVGEIWGDAHSRQATAQAWSRARHLAKYLFGGAKAMAHPMDDGARLPSRRPRYTFERMLKKKICMLGSFGVGKTSLVARFVNSMFTDKYQTTVGVKIDKKELRVEGRDLTLMLWDMAGEEDASPIKLSQVRDAAGYLLVIDGCRRKTLEVAVSIQQRVANEIGPRPFLLLPNKADERPNWEIADSAWEEFAGRGWTVIETSAKTGQNVEEAFHSLASLILAQDDDSSSDE
jgi:small GTP-binding protein